MYVIFFNFKYYMLLISVNITNSRTMPRPSVTIEELSADMSSLYSLQVSNVKNQLCYDDATFLFTGNGKKLLLLPIQKSIRQIIYTVMQ